MPVLCIFYILHNFTLWHNAFSYSSITAQTLRHWASTPYRNPTQTLSASESESAPIVLTNRHPLRQVLEHGPEVGLV